MASEPVQLANDDPNREDWMRELKRIGDDRGFYEELGPAHTALFVRSGKTLVVTFENLDHVYEHADNRLPWGFDFVQARGWSILGLMAHEWTWYRDEAVLDFFDRLRDEGFFAEFDRVVFYGASMGAYAAAAFSAACPGSTVIAISPQATLDRELTSWETRYRRAWRYSYKGRFGFAPEHAASAENVYLFYDPLQPLDAMHASLFAMPNVKKFRCRHFGHRIASSLVQMGILKPVVEACVNGDLSETEFYRLLRARREFRRYLRHLLLALDEMDRPYLSWLLCRHVLDRMPGPSFRKTLKAIDERRLPASTRIKVQET